MTRNMPDLHKKLIVARVVRTEEEVRSRSELSDVRLECELFVFVIIGLRCNVLASK